MFSIKPALFIRQVGYQHYRQKAERRHYIRKGLPIIAESI
jgi:hypothetical protein